MEEKYKREIPHIKQSEEIRNCGAVCIKMLYEKSGIPIKIEDIWNDVTFLSPLGSYYCRNNLMIKHLHKHGFQACMVFVDDALMALNECDKYGIDVILNHRINVGEVGGHMTIYLYNDYQGIHINDPMLDAGDRIINIEIFDQLMKRDGQEIMADNGMMLINLNPRKLPTITLDCEDDPVEIFSSVFPRVLKVVSPKHDDIFSVL